MNSTTEELVEELHVIRETMLAEAGASLGALVARLKMLEAQQVERVIPPPTSSNPRPKGEVA